MGDILLLLTPNLCPHFLKETFELSVTEPADNNVSASFLFIPCFLVFFIPITFFSEKIVNNFLDASFEVYYFENSWRKR